jgi:hypothetical protein
VLQTDVTNITDTCAGERLSGMMSGNMQMMAMRNLSRVWSSRIERGVYYERMDGRRDV